MKFIDRPSYQATRRLDLWSLQPDEVPEPALTHVRAVRQVAAAWQYHFEGQPRGQCDLLRLRELLSRCAQARVALGLLQMTNRDWTLRGYLSALDDQIRLFSSEAEQIHLSRNEPFGKARSGWLVRRAGDQLRLYQLHCGDRSRRARRPQLLWRIVDNLEAAGREFAAAEWAAVETAEGHHELAEQVRRDGAVIQQEALTIQEIHHDLAPADRVTALVEEWTLLKIAFQAEADPRDDPVQRLIEHCDQVDEIALQLAELSAVSRHATTQYLLQEVQTYLAGLPAPENQRSSTPGPAGPFL